MNISKGVKRLEILLYAAWTTFTAYIAFGYPNLGQEELLNSLLLWLGGIAPVWGIAWVLKGFLDQKTKTDRPVSPATLFSNLFFRNHNRIGLVQRHLDFLW